jgi:hypothetical protein
MKKQFTSGLVLSLGLLFFFPSCTKKEGEVPVPTTLETGLVAHYPFNGNAEDKSGKGRHATVSGAVLTTDRSGQSNSAYLFDGLDDLISASSTSGLTNSNLTYSAWIKPTANPAASSYTTLVSIGGMGADQCMTINNNYHSTLGVNVGGYNTITTVSNASSVSSKQLPVLSEWVHVTYTRSNTDIKLYLNGELKGSVTTNDALPKYTTPAIFTMGTRYNKSEGFFKGAMDEVRIYDRALSATEVQELFKQ